eukprot:6661500-Pyramimonas_sp.AAC.2
MVASNILTIAPTIHIIAPNINIWCSRRAGTSAAEDRQAEALSYAVAAILPAPGQSGEARSAALLAEGLTPSPGGGCEIDTQLTIDFSCRHHAFDKSKSSFVTRLDSLACLTPVSFRDTAHGNLPCVARSAALLAEGLTPVSFRDTANGSLLCDTAATRS